MTESEARADMMHWRRLFPAICVGSGTVLADNPSLTARLPGETFCPVRLVIDSDLSTFDPKSDRSLYTDELPKNPSLDPSVGLAQKARVSRAQELGISLIQTKHARVGGINLSLPQVLDQIGLNGVYCEGGASSQNPFWKKDLPIISSAINLPGISRSTVRFFPHSQKASPS